MRDIRLLSYSSARVQQNHAKTSFFPQARGVAARCNGRSDKQLGAAMSHLALPRLAIAAVALASLSSACTSMRPMHLPSTEIQDRVRAGDLLFRGDRVKLYTADGATHELRVAEVDLNRDVIDGRDDAVPIGEIVGVERREHSWIKTGLLVGGVVIATFGSSCEDDCGDGPFADAGFFCCP
jgi:hypothetical protein